jgi:hypothetical protein
MHSTGEARVNTPGLVTVPALKGKRHFAISFHTNARQSPGRLSLKCFYNISRPGMLSQAINPAKPAAHASLFFYINSFHSHIPLYGIRLPLAVHNINTLPS